LSSTFCGVSNALPPNPRTANACVGAASFVPITFELTILFAAFTAILAMFALNGLPQPYHPVFNVPRFALATRDRFFLCIEARDPKFDPAATKQFLESLNPHGVYEVEP